MPNRLLSAIQIPTAQPCHQLPLSEISSYMAVPKSLLLAFQVLVVSPLLVIISCLSVPKSLLLTFQVLVVSPQLAIYSFIPVQESLPGPQLVHSALPGSPPDRLSDGIHGIQTPKHWLIFFFLFRSHFSGPFRSKWCYENRE